MKSKTRFLTDILLPFAALAVSPATAQTWSQLAASGSPPNSSAFNSTNYDPANNLLMTFIPEGGGTPSQVWTLTNANGLGGTPTWAQLQPSGTVGGNNGGGSAVYDAAANQLIVYGGCTGNCSPVLDSVYVLSNANGIGGTPAWSQSLPTSSIARTGQTAVYDPTRNVMITFGGDTGFFGTSQNDTNVLSPANGSSPTWTTLTTAGGPPPTRTGAVAVYDISHNRMILFGGQQINSPTNIPNFNDVWVLSHANGHGATPTWTNLQPDGDAPPPRSHCGAVYDSTANVMYIFGGLRRSADAQTVTPVGDVWKLTNANGLGTETPT